MGALALASPRARAGGFDELPDQGAQALGRGATFTAKADDATALYWNVAGLARQRGTKLQISANLHFNKLSFARSGTYADDPSDPATPWGGEPYPVVADRNASFVLPMLVATSDLGISERLTFGAGVFGPAATGRTFPMGVNGLPAPSRYDFVQSRSTVLFPTLGAAYRVTRYLDLGLAGHLVFAEFDELTVAYADVGGGACKSVEDFRCDAEARLQAKGLGATASVAGLVRPFPSLQIGAQLRAPASVTGQGTASTKLGSAALTPGPASVTLDLPWMARAGVRYIGLDERAGASPAQAAFERWDLEVDGTYEAWGSAQHEGPVVTTTDPAGGDAPTRVTSLHRWKDTFSVRLGGAYNVPLDRTHAVLSLRAGAFFDSATTDAAYTRLDTNTLAKLAGTAGLGLRVGPVSANVGYAAVASLPRTVTDGDIRPANGAKGGLEVDGDGKPLPAVNNGEYRAFTHLLSFGVEVNFEAFFRDRRPTYGDPTYEAVPGPPGDEARRATEPSATKGDLAHATEPRASELAPSATADKASDASSSSPPDPDEPRWWEKKADEEPKDEGASSTESTVATNDEAPRSARHTPAKKRGKTPRVRRTRGARRP